jgi:alpha-N-acetylglucosamine transferase
MKNDLFDETFVLINCVLRNKILTIAMIDIDVTEYAFVDETVAQSLCEALKIESVQLIKKSLIKVYDERKDQIITHVIYSKMIIQRHTESLTLMLIIKLRQQTLILDKS